MPLGVLKFLTIASLLAKLDSGLAVREEQPVYTGTHDKVSFASGPVDSARMYGTDLENGY